METIQVISSCLVGTTTNSDGNNSRIIELSPWDLQFLPLDPIQKGLLFHKPYYNNKLSATQNLDETYTTLIHHLKISLSRTLDFFPPLAGRLYTTTNPKNDTTSFFLDCNNSGVEFTHAIARGVSISDILEPKYVPEIVYSLFPLNGVSNFEGTSKPLLGVQVTELCDGFFIGCTLNHAIADGTSFWHFFNSWSETSRGLPTISRSPVFKRGFPRNIFPDGNDHHVPLPSSELQSSLSSTNSFATTDIHQIKERVFRFSKERIAKLKDMAKPDTENNISSLQALCVHLWRSVIRGRISVNQVSRNDDVKFKLLVGARGRIPLPEGYFGAAVHAVDLSMPVEELLQPNGQSCSALKLNELVAQQTEEEVVQFVEDWVKNPTLLRKGVTSFVISSSPRFDVYGCDFGWGKPVAVRSGMGQMCDGKMTVFPAEEPGGIDVQVCLATETMKALEDDAEFMDAVTA